MAAQPSAPPPYYQGQAAMAMPPQPYGTADQQAFTPWQPNQASDAGPSYQGDDIHDTDPEDNDDDEAPPSNLPPSDINSFEAPPGYEQSGVAAGAPLPPPAYQPPDEASQPMQTFTGIGTMNVQQVRDAICAFADKQCCYGTGAAERMVFEKMDPSGGLHYQLESFTETRSTSWEHLPYRGGPIDGPDCGLAPAVWDIACSPFKLFDNHDKLIEIPHTSNIKVCHNCTGCGFVRCPRCHGRGSVTCFSCNGSGHSTYQSEGKTETRTCSFCSGSGNTRCDRCGGRGRITCPICEGFAKLRWYIQLKVQYINNVEDFIHEPTDLPDELIRDVSGKSVFEQTLPYVWPISQYDVPEINENSFRIVERHRNAWPESKLIQQRQILRSVPITEVKYMYKQEGGRFWVYGNEHEVHCPEYPQQCCWGCTIL
ncbi:protein SSUH2 homolog [Apostichopus japonicus]|uniref:protein SSUH2 homolog n=1 Tax=Stichopus japonicus TaxID=307972 RepID=UPI003AB7C7FC